MNKPKFSSIRPVYIYNEQRMADLDRCMTSVLNQTVHNFEHIIINDGSPIEMVVDDPPHITYLQQDHLERLYAFNKGFEKATGDWICLLDSDDEYMSYYLEVCEKAIEAYPDKKMFNFGSIHISQDYKARVRDSFKPEMLEVGHEIFGGGNIVNGTYIFHKSVLKELGGFPNTASPWDFSVMAQDEFPELKPLFTVDHPDHPEGVPKELGNPWGQDFYLFYKYTRKYHSVPFDAHIYVVHPSRIEHKLIYERN